MANMPQSPIMSSIPGNNPTITNGSSLNIQKRPEQDRTSRSPSPVRDVFYFKLTPSNVSTPTRQQQGGGPIPVASFTLSGTQSPVLNSTVTEGESSNTLMETKGLESSRQKPYGEGSKALHASTSGSDTRNDISPTQARLRAGRRDIGLRPGLLDPGHLSAEVVIEVPTIAEPSPTDPQLVDKKRCVVVKRRGSRAGMIRDMRQHALVLYQVIRGIEKRMWLEKKLFLESIIVAEEAAHTLSEEEETPTALELAILSPREQSIHAAETGAKHLAVEVYSEGNQVTLSHATPTVTEDSSTAQRGSLTGQEQLGNTPGMETPTGKAEDDTTPVGKPPTDNYPSHTKRSAPTTLEKVANTEKPVPQTASPEPATPILKSVNTPEPPFVPPHLRMLDPTAPIFIFRKSTPPLQQQPNNPLKPITTGPALPKSTVSPLEKKVKPIAGPSTQTPTSLPKKPMNSFRIPPNPHATGYDITKVVKNPMQTVDVKGLRFTAWPKPVNRGDMPIQEARTVIISDFPPQPSLAIVSLACKNTGKLENIIIDPLRRKALVTFIEANVAHNFYMQAQKSLELVSRNGADGTTVKRRLFVQMDYPVDMLPYSIQERIFSGKASRMVTFSGWERHNIEALVGKEGEVDIDLEILLMRLAERYVPNSQPGRVEAVTLKDEGWEFLEGTLLYAGIYDGIAALDGLKLEPEFKGCDIGFGKDPCEPSL